ncbi:MAG: hypothetical protein IKK34_14410 [Clostridia bacterium]|nr:hypothetical protein [Clostridia bacterium]
MKTPEEIKKGLEYLAERDPAKKVELWEKGIAYDWQEEAAGDALAYIQQLEATVSEKENVIAELSGKGGQLEAKRKQLIEKIELLEATAEG